MEQTRMTKLQLPEYIAIIFFAYAELCIIINVFNIVFKQFNFLMAILTFVVQTCAVYILVHIILWIGRRGYNHFKHKGSD